MRELILKIRDALTIKTKRRSYVPKLIKISGILAIVVGLLGLAYMAFCSSAHFTAEVNLADSAEHAIVLTFGWVMVAWCFVIFFDMLYRRHVSHILVTGIGGLIFVGYHLAQGIYRIGNGDIGNAVVYLLTVALGIWSVLFFFKKAMDGDASWLMKTVYGLTILLGFCCWGFTYTVLEAFSHFGDALFWDGVVVGLLYVAFFAIVGYVSIVSDYDPHPIEVDELGNMIETDENK